MLELKHRFNFSQAILIKPIYWKKFRRQLESAVIYKTNHVKQRSGFYHTRRHYTKRKQNQNIKRIEDISSFCATILLRIFSLSLYLSLFLTPIASETPQLRQSSVILHYSQYLSTKLDMPKLLPKPFHTSPHQLDKIYLNNFHNKNL